MRQREHYSVAQLSDIFRGANVKRRGALTVVRAVEDSYQEFFLRHILMNSGGGNSRFCREFKTINAAATPFYEFELNTDHLKANPYDQAQKLGWVLDNMLSDKPYEFGQQQLG